MGQRVLVVDDEKLIVKGIRFSLEQTVWKLIVHMMAKKRWDMHSRTNMI